jgi:arsenate reductase
MHIIYHNPKCGTSRNTLSMIRNSGVEPLIIEYLTNPPTRDELIKLIKNAGLTVRDAIRQKESIYRELNLDEPQLSDDFLINVMLENPILINRPFVVTEIGTRLCRPSELVLEILPNPQQSAFSKEDGELVINEKGQHVTTEK